MAIENTISSLEFLNKHMPEFKLKKESTYRTHVDSVVSALSNDFFKNPLAADRFKELPSFVQVEVVIKKFCPSCFNLLKAAAQQKAFDLYGQAVKGCIFEFKENELKIRENQLSSEQLYEALSDLSDDLKLRVEILDLSALSSLENLMCLEGYSSLKSLILPAKREMTSMEGIETVGQQLRKIGMKNSGIKSLDFLQFCPNLEELDASSCGMLFSIRGLEKCTKLKSLQLPKTSALPFSIRQQTVTKLLQTTISFID